MAMNVGSGGEGKEPEVMMDINTTPLIDVMLVLLIMLIITIPVQTHAVKLDMPVGTPPPPVTPPQVVDILVDFDGSVTWTDETTGASATVDENQLEINLSHAADAVPQPEIHLHPNKLVKYAYVARVMAAAQRIGVDKIGLVGDADSAQ